MSTGEVSRRSTAVWTARKRAAGYKRLSLWVHPFALDRLRLLALEFGSLDASVEEAVRAYELPEEEGSDS